MSDARPIGVFDSGVGGLTVVRAIFDLLPHEPSCTSATTAGSRTGRARSRRSARFGLEIASELVARDVKMLVVACNSIEVAAIEDVARAHGVPVVGVVEPGARAAVHATRNGTIGMIGTEATVASGAYDRAVTATGATVRLVSRACPAFVDYVERGDTSSRELLRPRARVS